MTAFKHLAIPEIIEIIPPKSGDHRGFFSEVFKRSALEAEGLHIDWVQDNQSLSVDAGTIRGLHLQLPPIAQHKLIRVLRGAIYDVAVDVRVGSPTYGQWVGCELSAKRWNQLLVPIGFAHGFMTLEPNTEVLYKVSNRWSPEHERTLLWNDPDIGIDWPVLPGEPILVERDNNAPGIADFTSTFVYGEN